MKSTLEEAIKLLQQGGLLAGWGGGGVAGRSRRWSAQRITGMRASRRVLVAHAASSAWKRGGDRTRMATFPFRDKRSRVERGRV